MWRKINALLLAFALFASCFSGVGLALDEQTPTEPEYRLVIEGDEDYVVGLSSDNNTVVVNARIKDDDGNDLVVTDGLLLYCPTVFIHAEPMLTEVEGGVVLEQLRVHADLSRVLNTVKQQIALLLVPEVGLPVATYQFLVSYEELRSDVTPFVTQDMNRTGGDLAFSYDQATNTLTIDGADQVVPWTEYNIGGNWVGFEVKLPTYREFSVGDTVGIRDWSLSGYHCQVGPDDLEAGTLTFYLRVEEGDRIYSDALRLTWEIDGPSEDIFLRTTNMIVEASRVYMSIMLHRHPLVGQAANFTVYICSHGEEGLVNIYFEDLPVGALLEYEEAGEWFTLTDIYGPEEGFSLVERFHRFRATFAESGEYSIPVQLKSVTGDILAEKTLEASVQVPFYQLMTSADISRVFSLSDTEPSTGRIEAMITDQNGELILRDPNSGQLLYRLLTADDVPIMFYQHLQDGKLKEMEISVEPSRMLGSQDTFFSLLLAPMTSEPQPLHVGRIQYTDSRVDFPDYMYQDPRGTGGNLTYNFTPAHGTQAASLHIDGAGQEVVWCEELEGYWIGVAIAFPQMQAATSIQVSENNGPMQPYVLTQKELDNREFYYYFQASPGQSAMPLRLGWLGGNASLTEQLLISTSNIALEGMPEFRITQPLSVLTNHDAEFEVQLVANRFADENVTLAFGSNPNVRLFYAEGDDWVEFTGAYKPHGFALTDSTIRFKAISGVNGTHNIPITLQTLTGVTLGSADLAVRVHEPIQIQGLFNSFEVNKQQLFMIRTTPGVHFGRMVKAHFSHIPEGATVEYLESGIWYALEGNVYGAANGFPLGNSRWFRARFDTAGIYPIEARFIDVATGELLGEYKHEMMVADSLVYRLELELPISLTSNDNALVRNAALKDQFGNEFVFMHDPVTHRPLGDIIPDSSYVQVSVHSAGPNTPLHAMTFSIDTASVTESLTETIGFILLNDGLYPLGGFSVEYTELRDFIPPVITLVGQPTVHVPVGSTYTDAGATAMDEHDGDITAQIVTTGQVNTSVAGTYSIRYNVSDASGNAALEVTRTVIVYVPYIPPVEEPTPPPAEEPAPTEPEEPPVEEPVINEPVAEPVEVPVQKETSVSEDGKVTESFTVSEEAEELIVAAKEEGKTTIEFKVSEVDPVDGEEAPAVTEVTVPTTILTAAQDMSVVVTTTQAALELPPELVNALAGSGQNLSIVVERGDVEQVTAAVKESAVVVSEPVSISTQIVGLTRVSIPCAIELPEDEAERDAFLAQLSMFVIHSDGEEQMIHDLEFRYSEEGTRLTAVRFWVEKFSTFALVRVVEQTEQPAEPLIVRTLIDSRTYTVQAESKAFDSETAFRANPTTTVMAIRLFEELGATFTFDRVEGIGVITMRYDEVVVVLKDGSNLMQITDESGTREATMRAAAVITNGRTYIPTRDVSENLGFQVDWVREDDSITITRK